MRPVKRYSVNKRSSANQFRNRVDKTKAINFRVAAMRGGYRM